jgi:hypothetical protein
MYEIAGAQPLNSGNYQVVVANATAFVESAGAAVQVQPGTGPLRSPDNFTNRIRINPLLGPVLGNNANASAGAEGPALIADKPAGKTIWYTWQASFTGVISLTTLGSDFDTLLGVYTGTNAGALTAVAADDDSGGYFTSAVTFNVTAGTSYQIAVSGYKGAFGNVVLGMPAGTGYRVLSTSLENHVPVITSQPASQLVTAGNKGTLSVETISGQTCQWFFNGAPVRGQTNSSLVLSDFGAGAVGLYDVLVANAVGSVESEPATLQIAGSNQPGAGGSSQDKFGDAVDLAGPGSGNGGGSAPAAGGGDTRGYSVSQVFSTVGATKEAGEPNHCGQAGGASQWFIYTAPGNGTLDANLAGSDYNTIVAIYTGPGTNFASLLPQACGYVTNYQAQGQPNVLVPNVTAGTRYYIAVDGYNGASGTVQLHLGLGAAPTLVSGPASQAVAPGSNATFSVTAVGTTNFSYQWQRDGLNVAGGTNASLTVTNAQAAQAGSYRVIVSNVVGVVTSAPSAVLTVQLAPEIVKSPVSETVLLGQPAALAVTAGGVNIPGDLLRYQWRYGTAGASVGLAGATNATLALAAAQWTNNGSYFVVVTNNYGAATSAVAVLTVRETNAPTVAITSPANNFVTNAATVTVTGTAADKVGVAAVEVAVNNTTNLAMGATRWTNVVTLTPGTNLLTVRSVNVAGSNSAPAQLRLIYLVSGRLTVQTNGDGGVSSASGATNGATLVLGRNYTILATPASNNLFANWSAGTNGGALTNYPGGTNLTFLMSSNLVLQANFATNPFGGLAGVYNGLFYPASGVTEASSGFLTATVTGQGAYSAKLLLAGGSNVFSGTFDVAGVAQTNLARAGQSGLSVALTLDLNPADARLSGVVSNQAAGGWSSELEADRAVFNASAHPASNYAGQFTLLLPPGNNAPAGSPDGYGYAALTNTLGGIATLGGALADGTPILWSAPLAQDGSLPLYQSLYGGQGSLLGWIIFTNQPPQNVASNSWISWIKPARPGTLYPAGFTNLSQSGVLGSPYTNTTLAGVPVLNLTHGVLLLTNGNLEGGGLLYPDIGTNVQSHNTLTNLEAGTGQEPTNHLAISINPGNGVVTVTFQPTGQKTNTIAHGAVLQNQTNALGAFPGATQSGSLLLK